MDYVENVRKDVFFLEQMLRQEQMKRYIQECQIFASGKDIGYKLNSLNEDLKESANSLWTKIKTIFNRIWLKFLERIDHFCKSDAEYLKSYQNIILNKKVPDANFTMPDYGKVKERCFKLPPDYSSIINPKFMEKMRQDAMAGVDIEAEKLDAKKDEWRIALRKAIGRSFGISESEIKEDTDFAVLTKEFFGGNGDVDVSSSEINMADAYNLCFSAEVFIKNLKKDQTNYNKWIEDMQKEYNSEYKAFMAEIRKNADVEKQAKAAGEGSDEHKNAIKTAAGEEIKKTQDAMEAEKKDNNSKIQAAQDSTDKAQTNEDYNLYSVVYNKVLNEVGISSSPSSDNKSDVVKGGTASGAQNMNNSETNRKIDTAMKANTSKQSDDASIQKAAAGASARKDANTDANDDKNYERITEKNVNAFTTLVTSYTTIATETISTIFGAKCNAIEKMRRDYMQIIRFHVKYWLGRPNNTDDNVTPSPTPGSAPGVGMSR